MEVPTGHDVVLKMVLGVGHLAAAVGGDGYEDPLDKLVAKLGVHLAEQVFLYGGDPNVRGRELAPCKLLHGPNQMGADARVERDEPGQLVGGAAAAAWLQTRHSEEPARELVIWCWETQLLGSAFLWRHRVVVEDTRVLGIYGSLRVELKKLLPRCSCVIDQFVDVDFDGGRAVRAASASPRVGEAE